MKYYNFTPENIDDINTQKSNFFAEIATQISGLVDLGIYDFENLYQVEKSFWKIFTENHLEIRTNERLVRHFILKKREKLAKELKMSLFMSELCGNFPQSSLDEYWKFIHTMFLVFETAHESKSEAIVNTLTEELEKVLEKEQQIVLGNANTTTATTASSVVESSENLSKKLNSKIGRKARQRTKSNQPEAQFDMSKLNSMMENIGIDPSKSLDATSLMNMMEKMMSNTEENPLKQLGLGSDMKDLDMSNLLNQFMPGFADSKNDNLMDTLISDITLTMDNLESADQAVDMTKKLGEKYQNMIASGQVEPSEIIGSLMGLLTDEKFTEELEKVDISKINPEDLMSKMMSEISPQMISQLTGGLGEESGGLDLGNIGSLVSSVTGLAGKSNNMLDQNNTEPEKELTAGQIKELEEYYTSINIENSQPELD